MVIIRNYCDPQALMYEYFGRIEEVFGGKILMPYIKEKLQNELKIYSTMNEYQ